jgi:hypothetical protein
MDTKNQPAVRRVLLCVLCSRVRDVEDVQDVFSLQIRARWRVGFCV